MRILQLVDHWSGGGVPAMIKLIADVLEKNGHHVKIISYRDSDYVPPIQYNYQSLRARFPGDPIALFRLRSELKRFNPDVIHDHYGGLWAWSYLLQKKWRKRALLHVHNEFDVVEDSPDQSRPMRTNLFLKAVLPLYPHIAAVSQAVKDTLIRIQPDLEKRIDVIHNAINCQDLRDQPALERSTKQHFQNYELLLGCVGRLVFEKGADRVLEVLRELRKQEVQAGLVVVGDGDRAFERKLKAMREEYHLEEHCHFMGRQTHIFSWMRLMDLFMFASRQEPFGLTLLEAMCAETPIVALPADQNAGPKEFLNHRENALLTSSRDPEEIAEQIIAWRSEQNLFDKIVEGGKQTLKQFNLEAYNQRLTNIYDQY
jgi:glycosyltransferase involved in cell wall biosynthesis